MKLLDASAVIAFLTAERAAPNVRTVLDEGPVTMTSTQLAEVVDKLVRGRGISLDVTRRTLARMDVSIRPLTSELAWRAGTIRPRHYHRIRCPLSLAECVLLASAADGDTIVSADRAVLATADDEGVAVLELPSSTA